jgi:PTH1 family peptidyl-tRNA hydrolase
MWLIAGLGNPGPEYAATRHNIGFMAIDALADTLRVSNFSKKFQGEITEANCAGERVLLLKPMTFMNLSGQSVQAASAFYKIPPEQIIVLHDELDLPVSKLRIKQGGGNNGHNGLRDIDRCLGDNYWRIRLGIGHPGDKHHVHSHVLNNFSVNERPLVVRQLEALCAHLPLFWERSPEVLASKIALALNPPVKKSAPEAMDGHSNGVSMKTMPSE